MESDNNQSSEVSPEFKQTLDEYEAFIDDYIAFLDRYEDSDDVTGMLIEYTSYIAKFTEIMAELDAVNKSELSDADALYFTEVSYAGSLQRSVFCTHTRERLPSYRLRLMKSIFPMNQTYTSSR